MNNQKSTNKQLKDALKSRKKKAHSVSQNSWTPTIQLKCLIWILRRHMDSTAQDSSNIPDVHLRPGDSTSKHSPPHWVQSFEHLRPHKLSPADPGCIHWSATMGDVLMRQCYTSLGLLVCFLQICECFRKNVWKTVTFRNLKGEPAFWSDPKTVSTPSSNLST